MRRRSALEEPEEPPLELRRFVLKEWLHLVGEYDPDAWYADHPWSGCDWRLLVAEELWTSAQAAWLDERELPGEFLDGWL